MPNVLTTTEAISTLFTIREDLRLFQEEGRIFDTNDVIATIEDVDKVIDFLEGT